MDIKTFLSPGDVLIDVGASDKTRLLQKLADRAEVHSICRQTGFSMTSQRVKGSVRLAPVLVLQFRMRVLKA